MEVQALHVSEGNDTTRISTQGALDAGVELQLRQGPVVETILAALQAAKIFGGIMGTRAFLSGPRPAGSVALQVISGGSKPVVLVPPDAHHLSANAPRRLLVPLDGSAAASAAFLGFEQRFAPDPGREINVLLTFDGMAPSMLDHDPHGIEAWGREFVERQCPGDHRAFHGREGDPGDAVINVAEQTHSDLIILSFGGNIAVGHGAVVREVLTRSQIPVLLLPIRKSH
jgi:nucleotide-binding universal stress UspA family protein